VSAQEHPRGHRSPGGGGRPWLTLLPGAAFFAASPSCP
jgi:hypothetical protein